MQRPANTRTTWEHIIQSVTVGLLSFAGFFMWNAGQTLNLLDYRMEKVEHRVDKLEA